MESRPGVTRWATEQWDAVGVTVGDRGGEFGEVVVENGEYRQTCYGGLRVSMFEDEAESYYHNLMSPNPGIFIVATVDEDDAGSVPVPRLVTLSFDEAHAYLEGGETVFTVPLCPELYRWVEAYVLQFYVPGKKRRRKRVDWKRQGHRS